MTTISSTLLGSTTAGSQTALPIESSKAKGCGYYGQNDGLHTVQYVLNGFVGNIVIQGSLEGKPTDDDWFDIVTASITGTAPLGITTTTSKNFAGDFVWVRAVVPTFTSGNINRVLFTHN